MYRTITIIEPDALFDNKEKYFFVKEDPFEESWVSKRKEKGFRVRNIVEPWSWKGILNKIEEARENNWTIHEETIYESETL